MPVTQAELMTQLNQVGAQLELMDKKLDEHTTRAAAVDTVIKGLQESIQKTNPAHDAQKLLMGMTQKGTVPGIYGDGSFWPVDVNRARREQRVIGKRRNEETGFEGTFGEYLGAFYKWQFSKQQDQDSLKKLMSFGVGVQTMDSRTGLIQKAALNESSGVAGGYTVPPMFLEVLQRIPAEEAVMESGAHTLPLDSLTLTVPSLDITTSYGAGQTPFAGGVKATWSPETVINESEPQFRSTELTAHFLGLYAIASIQLLRDNAVLLDPLLTELFRIAAVWAKDYAFLQGSGVGQPLGVINAPACITVQRIVPNQVRWQDVNQMISKIWSPLLASRLTWVAHQSVIPQLLGMVDPAGNPVFIPRSAGVQESVDTKNNIFGYLCGFPVRMTEKLPALGTTGDLLLLDRGFYLVGQRQDIEMELSPHVKFLNYQMVWRVALRLDGQSWLNNPITLGDGTYQVSPFVTLHS